MIVRYSGKSAISARRIAEAGEDIQIVRHGFGGDVNWGRNRANTKLNPNISNSTNKRRMRQLFKEHDVPMPKDIEPTLAFGPWSENKPVVGRPDTHSQGRGFWLCKNSNDVSRALMGTRRKKAATHFMEYIEADAEYRVHIFLGQSIRISQKAFTDDSKEEYTTIKPPSRRNHVRQAAKDAVAALGLDFGTVDILTKGDEVYVLEVNAAPGLGGTMPKLWADTFNNWYKETNYGCRQ